MPSENPTPTLPDCAIHGFGYLGRPLALKLYEHGSRVVALKRSLTSDDINLPLRLDITDLNQAGVFQTAFWQEWADYPTWFWLLPPSALKDYCGVLSQWLKLAESFQVQHLIFTSSTSVYGDAPRFCDETAPPDPQTDNAKMLLAAEKLLLESRIPHIDILRLGGLYCAERHPVSRLSGRQNIKGGSRPVNVIRRDLAVEILFQTASNPQGRRLGNAVEPDHPGRAEFYTREAAKLGLAAPGFDPADTSGGKVVGSIGAGGLSL
ncbi:Rossmann-fold NAD(P)-binding domain-containing protein [Neisseria chenwenguii]|uniref:NAD(P)-dependent oxidoreductase n=1 Tax=Neisseria chenwenguii TaxID=1853278 RepID=A0A220S4L0_9NEIS|nr:NAD(P)-dependent oxidoreductase [Neisseria chenwenguii]ASK28380.1 NAD(P)-dependent oxidoreductase [Neisseria chenwenguii]ROV56015.1 SDR family NAD(P)-dependent oxidoreductase [Neisseria chenwenguii]